jgi:hypothetical protein
MVANSGWFTSCSVLARSFNRAVLRALWLAAAATTLVACGGSGSSSGSGSLPPATGSSPATPPATPPPPANPPARKGDVVVRAITTAGVPVSGMSVGLNGVGQVRPVTTNANGEATFKDVPVGDGSAVLGGSGYHWAGRRFTVTDGSQTRVTVSLQRVTEAVPVLLATYPAKPSDDGRLLTVEADVAILAADGSSRADLVAADFEFEGSCGWYVCVTEADGRDTYAGYGARATAASFNSVAVPPGASSAVGVLIEQSATMGTFDPQGLRLQAVRDYLDRVLPPNLVTLASQRDTGTAPILTTYGGFTSDGSRFRNAIDGLRGQESGDSRTLQAIAEMAGFMKASIAGASGSPRQAMVVVTSWEPGCPDPSTPGTCETSTQSAAEAAQAAGVAVIAAGHIYSGASAVATSTGGAAVAIEDPAQWPVLFRALDPLVLGGLPYYRVRLELDAGAPGVFIKGRRVRGELTIRVGTDTRLHLWDLAVPI